VLLDRAGFLQALFKAPVSGAGWLAWVQAESQSRRAEAAAMIFFSVVAAAVWTSDSLNTAAGERSIAGTSNKQAGRVRVAGYSTPLPYS
jgi:hypothetical protein